MVSNRDLLKSKCGLGVFSRGARKYLSILKILVETFLQFYAISPIASGTVVYCALMDRIIDPMTSGKLFDDLWLPRSRQTLIES